MTIPQMIKESDDLSEWIDNQLAGLSIKAEDRFSFAGGCFHIALEHQRAIILLIQNRCFGSALSLVRLIYEALVRGVWLHHCASEEQIEDYKADKPSIHFVGLFKAVEKISGWEGGFFSSAHPRLWNLMNSFTHNGIRQVECRMNEQDFDASYHDNQILDALIFSGVIALLCGKAVANLANDIGLASSMLDRAKKFAALKD